MRSLDTDIFLPECVSGWRCIRLEMHLSRIFLPLEFCTTIFFFSVYYQFQ